VNPRRRAQEIQSVHFANGNPANPMKTSRLKNSNRYTFTGVRATRFAPRGPLSLPHFLAPSISGVKSRLMRTHRS
jgi:hypothetical protein